MSYSFALTRNFVQAEQRLLAGDAAVTPQAEKRLHTAPGVVDELSLESLSSPQTAFLQQPRIALHESPSIHCRSARDSAGASPPPPYAQPAYHELACMPPRSLQLGALQLAADGMPYLPYGLLPPPPPRCLSQLTRARPMRINITGESMSV